MKIFYVKIDQEDNTGIDAISLVDYPAVEKSFLCFKENKPIQLKFNSDKHVITGVVALADVPIYRFNQQLGEYFIVFTKDVIRQMVEKFAKQDLFKSVNLQHDDTQFQEGIYMFESYLVDRKRGILPVEFSDVTDGSWIASFKVDNQELWDKIINSNELNGFSLQGFFHLEEQDDFDNWINNLIKDKL